MEHLPHRMASLPRIAILDDNTLSCIGLRNLLQSIMPQIEIDSYCTFAELSASQPEQYYHFFVSLHQFLPNKKFFVLNNRKSIVMTTSHDLGQMMNGFHCFNVNQPEHEILKNLLSLVQGAHAHGKRLPAEARDESPRVLSEREIEVLSLIVKGLLNKEIADRLNISLSTVVTHRRNIMDKLNRRNVAALTIYAVMHGYVEVGDI